MSDISPGTPAAECLHATVEGRVQGVGFRYFVAHCAGDLGLTGWVRNRWDETVEVLAEGPRPALERFLGQLNRGPTSAYVSRVQVDWLPASHELRGFHIRPTD